jgi:hypothetical protein
MNPNHIPNNANYENKEPSVNLAEKAQLLLDNEQIKQLPEHEQGQFIIDNLLGRIVAAGNVKSGVGDKTPVDMVKDIEDFAKSSASDGYENALHLVTRKNGLRGMVHALSSDIRIGPLWTDLSRRLNVVHDSSNEVTMSSVPMISGYLDGIEESYHGEVIIGSGWKDTLLKETEEFSQSDARGRWQAQDLLSSDVASIRDNQLRWERAMADARTAGVDPNLVIRSAEHLRLKRRAGEDVGRAATAQAIEVTTYDHLFE